jgi:hypothetical protein
VSQADDPTTAGSEPRPVLSRACSLPVPVGVVERLEALRTEAREQAINFSGSGLADHATFCNGKDRGLMMAIEVINTFREAPEGNGAPAERRPLEETT